MLAVIVLFQISDKSLTVEQKAHLRKTLCELVTVERILEIFHEFVFQRIVEAYERLGLQIEVTSPKTKTVHMFMQINNEVSDRRASMEILNTIIIFQLLEGGRIFLILLFCCFFHHVWYDFLVVSCMTFSTMKYSCF